MGAKGQKLRDAGKMIRFARSLFRGRLVHTNLQLLYDCNFRCQICDFWKAEHKRHPRLSRDQVEEISDKLASVGPQIVSIGGGEPLLHPELTDIIAVLARKHFPVMICNGWFITPEIARALFAAGAYEVSVSVDYADALRHDAQRGMPGAHDRALSALRWLNENRLHPWQRVHMISVLLDDNLDQIEPLIHLCREMGITYLVTLYSDSRGTKRFRFVPGEVSETLFALKRKYPEFVALRGYLARFSEAIAEGGIGPCQTGNLLCNIDSQGNVTLCIDRLDEPLGNILREDMPEVERKLRQAAGENTCRSCWTSCRGNIESIRSGQKLLGNLWDYHQMTRGIPLAEHAGAAGRQGVMAES